MEPGKLAAQAGHAFVDAIRACKDTERLSAYHGKFHGIKVVLCARNLNHLRHAYEAVNAMGYPCALVTDLGYTVFNGVPTITAVGIGPARRSEINNIIKKYKLL